VLLIKANERREQRLMGVQPRVCGQHFIDHLMTDDVRRPDPEIDGDPQLTERDLGGFPRRDLCRSVERNGVPYDFHLALAHPLFREKLLCEICTFDLESSFYGGDLRQSKIV